jgi:type IV secretory pathway VirB2 component (pilin)
MKNIIELLKGKKTYIVAIIAVLVSLLGYLDGSMSSVEALYAVLAALGFTSVRAGSKTDAIAVIESRPTNNSNAVP